MSSPIKFYKSTALPDTPEPNAFYYIKNGSYADVYLTDSAGVPTKVGNTDMIMELTNVIDGGTFN
jgi:hypothetical protein